MYINYKCWSIPCVVYRNGLAFKTKAVYLLLIGRISQESVLDSSSNLLAVCVCGAMEADTAVHQRGLSKDLTAGETDFGILTESVRGPVLITDNASQISQ